MSLVALEAAAWGSPIPTIVGWADEAMTKLKKPVADGEWPHAICVARLFEDGRETALGTQH